MDLNTEISFDLNSKVANSILKFGLIVLSLITVVISIVFSLRAFASINKPAPDSGGGQLLNQVQVQNAFNLLQEKTVQYKPISPTQDTILQTNDVMEE